MNTEHRQGGLMSRVQTPRSPDDPVVCVFCRAPVPGRAKTRLAPALGADRAAALAAAMLLDVVDSVRAGGLSVCAAAAAEEDLGPLSALLPTVPVFAQPAGDLGHRMSAALDRLTRETGRSAAIVGADAVMVSPEVVRRAGRALARGADAAFCPARDGGYSLVAARRAVPVLFTDVAWGSGRVMDQTMARAVAAGLEVAEVGPLDDVDVVSDLARLAATLARAGSTPVAARTRHLIPALGVDIDPPCPA